VLILRALLTGRVPCVFLPAKADRLFFRIKPINVIEDLILIRQGKSFAVPAEIDYDYSKSINHL
jgi:hypothetical protein